jgi:hypothetical protein
MTLARSVKKAPNLSRVTLAFLAASSRLGTVFSDHGRMNRIESEAVGCRNLGEIERMYVEADDKPSIFKYSHDQIRLGLPFEPPWDLERPPTLATGSRAPVNDEYTCTNCGETIAAKADKILPPRPHCQNGEWISAAKT